MKILTSIFYIFLSCVVAHIVCVLSKGYGWLLLLLCGAVNFFKPEKYCFIAVFVVIMLDMVAGIAAQVKLKKFILSKIPDALVKIFVYCIILMPVYMAEKIIHDEGMFGIKAASIIAIACELWSISANLLIIKPNMPFLKIFRLQLKGEIEKKTGKNLDEVLKE